MKALLVSHSDFLGGAARASYRLHRAFLEANIDSGMLVRQRVTDDWTVQILPGSVPARVRERVESRIVRMQRTPNGGTHSVNCLPSRFAHVIDRGDIDVVNTHWLGAETLSVRDLARIRRPIILTLHDMWAFCGAEHYACESEDARWRVGYTKGNRPEGHTGLDLDRWTWQRKRRQWHASPIVCPTNWLASCVRQSALMRDWPVHVVPNPLDMTTFRPMDRVAARKILQLPREDRLVLFSAVGGVADARKGWDLLIEALAMLSRDHGDLVGVVVGQSEPRNPPRLGMQFRWMGPIADDVTLALVYNAVDLVVVPSRQDNLPQTATEAQACGTPVVAFDATGMPEAVVHGETGFLARPFDPASLAEGISWVSADADRRASLGHVSRDRAVRLWSAPSVVQRYREVYEDAIARHRYATRRA